MTDDEIKAEAAEATRQMMARLAMPEGQAELAASLAADNAGVSHEEFARRVRERTMGVKFNCRPSKFLRPPRVYPFVALVAAYKFVPWVGIPLWSWHETNWWLLLGMPACKLATRVSAQTSVATRPPVLFGYLLWCVAIALWATLGIHNYWTFFALCVAWGLWTFAKADQIESSYALQVLVSDKTAFERAASTGDILIVRA